MRSPQKALRDAESLLNELRITRGDLVNVMVCPFGEITIHLRPESFGRVFVALRVPRGKLDGSAGSSQHGRYVHATFSARRATFVTVIRVQQWEAMLRDWMAQLPDATRRIVQRSPALHLTGPVPEFPAN